MGLTLGVKVGCADNGVGSNVVGNFVGLGLGTTDGIGLGDTVGTVVGEGVVGDGVDKRVGKGVGDGVGMHVVQSNVSASTAPTMKLLSYISQSDSPIGGVWPHSPLISSATA